MSPTVTQGLDRLPGMRWLKDVARAGLDGSSLPLHVRFQMVRLGFKPESYVLYELDRNDAADYLPDRHWRQLADLGGEYVKQLLGNKLLFHLTFQHELPMPALLALVCRGRLVPVPGAASSIATVDDLRTHLRERGAVMLKPISGQKGKHVRSLGADGERLLVDGHEADLADVTSLLGRLDGAFVSERVRQASYAAAVYPDSTNTMRIVILQDVDTGEPFVATAAHRFGRVGTGPVDNVSSGGLAAGVVDLATGELGALQAFVPRPAAQRWLDEHPDTGAKVRGVRVPGWSSIVDDLLEFSRRHPYLLYVGWDVVRTDDGFRVLEANYGSGLQIQSFRPYLPDPRIRRFLEAHDVIGDALHGERLTRPTARSYTSRHA